MMELLNLPAEVTHMIISQCDLPALLQLRLVSKHIKIYVDTSTRFPEALETIQCDIELPYLISFVVSAPHLPFTNFRCEHYPILNSRGNSNFTDNEKSALRKFVELFCPHIRKLQVDVFFGCQQEAEFDLFQSLRNLRELRIGQLKVNLETDPHLLAPSENIKSLTRLPFTEPNLNIKQLLVDREEDCGEYLTGLIKMCPSVEAIQVTKSIGNKILGIDTFGPTQRINQMIGVCYPYVFRLGSEGHLKQLKRLNFDNQTVHMTLCSPNDIRFFQELVSNRSLRLENVTPALLYEVLRLPALSNSTKEAFKERIVSFNGISDLLNGADVTNLQELKFNSSVCWKPEGGNWVFNVGPLQLPQLKTLEAEVMNQSDQTEVVREFVEAVFYPDQPRSTVTNLTISHYKNRSIPNVRPRPSTLLDAFPNLKYLELSIGGDDLSKRQLCELLKAISGKPFLQELDLSCSKGIPEAAFFGDVPDQSPIFLKLKHLRKFTLRSTEMEYTHPKDIHQMGNKMMELLSKMSLTYLYICGEGWDDVTSGGIRKLVQGPFGRSVLYAKLEFEYKGNPDKCSGSLRRLARIVHNNRKARELTFSSFEEFNASDNEECSDDEDLIFSDDEQ